MEASEWTKIIRRDCKKAGTYQKFFESIIATLSDVLEVRDQARADFERSGGKTIIKHVNKGGNENIEQNPLLRMINDQNSLALQYWKELGLTPAALKKINESAATTKATGLEKALMEMAKERNG